MILGHQAGPESSLEPLKPEALPSCGPMEKGSERSRVAGSEDGGRGLEPRNLGAARESGKGKESNVPWSRQEEGRPATLWLSPGRLMRDL